MVNTIQIGDVFGEVKSVELQDTQTLADALRIAGMHIAAAQQLIVNSTSQPTNVSEVPVENEVYLITSNQTSA